MDFERDIERVDKTRLDYAIQRLKGLINKKADVDSLAKVATSGSYNDLSDKPTVPSVKDLNEEIERAKGKENELSENINEEITRAKESEEEIQNSIPTKVSQLENDNNYATISEVNVKADKTYVDTELSKKQDSSALSKVATSGDYNDLSNTPTIPSIEGLATEEYVNTEVAKKVDIIEGKQLSTEDYTTDEKTKLSSIAEGAEVNVQSDYGQNDETADDYIKNRTHYKKESIYYNTPEPKTVNNGFGLTLDLNTEFPDINTYSSFYVTYTNANNYNGNIKDIPNGVSITVILEYGKSAYKYEGITGPAVFGSIGLYQNGNKKLEIQTNSLYSTGRILIYGLPDGITSMVIDFETATYINVEYEDIKQLDDDFISDNIARVSDVEADIKVVSDKISDKASATNKVPSLEEVHEAIQRNAAAIICGNEQMSAGFQIQSHQFHTLFTTLTCLEDGPWYKIHNGTVYQCGVEKEGETIYVETNDVATVISDETLFYFYIHNIKYQRVKLGDPEKPWGAITNADGENIDLQVDYTTLGEPVVWILDDSTKHKAVHDGESSILLGRVDSIPSKTGVIEEYIGCTTLNEIVGKTPDATYDLDFPTSKYYCVSSQTADSDPKWTLDSSFNNVSFTDDEYAVLKSGATEEKISQIATNKTDIATNAGNIASHTATLSDQAKTIASMQTAIGNKLESSNIDAKNGLTVVNDNNKVIIQGVTSGDSQVFALQSELVSRFNSLSSGLSTITGNLSSEISRAQAAEGSLDTAIGTKQDALSEDQLTAANSGITSELVEQISTNETNITNLTTTVNGKQDAFENVSEEDDTLNVTESLNVETTTEVIKSSNGNIDIHTNDNGHGSTGIKIASGNDGESGSSTVTLSSTANGGSTVNITNTSTASNGVATTNVQATSANGTVELNLMASSGRQGTVNISASGGSNGGTVNIEAIEGSTGTGTVNINGSNIKANDIYIDNAVKTSGNAVQGRYYNYGTITSLTIAEINQDYAIETSGKFVAGEGFTLPTEDLGENEITWTGDTDIEEGETYLFSIVLTDGLILKIS